jgi:hypothetical protein
MLLRLSLPSPAMAALFMRTMMLPNATRVTLEV